MTDSPGRHAIFDAIATSLARRTGEPVALPTYEESLCVSSARLPADTLWDNFAANSRAVNGLPLRSATGLAAYLRDHEFRRGFCDPELQGELGPILREEGIEVLSTFERSRIDDYAFAITRAAGAIAESGSIILNDSVSVDRLAALAPWVHVAVVREADLLRTIPEAVARLGDSPSVIWVTGPSKTADIEGILIEGVHGPGVQICLCLP